MSTVGHEQHADERQASLQFDERGGGDPERTAEPTYAPKPSSMPSGKPTTRLKLASISVSGSPLQFSADTPRQAEPTPQQPDHCRQG